MTYELPRICLIIISVLRGKVAKVAMDLVTYRYTPGSWALGTSKEDLQKVRLKYLETNILSRWNSFMIYGFGKDAKKIYNMLSFDMKNKVTAFCDVDEKKIGRVHYCKLTRKHRNVIDYRLVSAPFVVCVASKRFSGEVEANIASLGFVAGFSESNYVQFC